MNIPFFVSSVVNRGSSDIPSNVYMEKEAACSIVTIYEWVFEQCRSAKGQHTSRPARNRKRRNIFRMRLSVDGDTRLADDTEFLYAFDHVGLVLLFPATHLYRPKTGHVPNWQGCRAGGAP